MTLKERFKLVALNIKKKAVETGEFNANEDWRVWYVDGPKYYVEWVRPYGHRSEQIIICGDDPDEAYEFFEEDEFKALYAKYRNVPELDYLFKDISKPYHLNLDLSQEELDLLLKTLDPKGSRVPGIKDLAEEIRFQTDSAKEI